MAFVRVTVEESVLQFVQNLLDELRKSAREETQVSRFKNTGISSRHFHVGTSSTHILPPFI